MIDTCEATLPADLKSCVAHNNARRNSHTAAPTSTAAATSTDNLRRQPHRKLAHKHEHNTHQLRRALRVDGVGAGTFQQRSHLVAGEVAGLLVSSHHGVEQAHLVLQFDREGLLLRARVHLLHRGQDLGLFALWNTPEPHGCREGERRYVSQNPSKRLAKRDKPTVTTHRVQKEKKNRTIWVSATKETAHRTDRMQAAPQTRQTESHTARDTRSEKRTYTASVVRPQRRSGAEESARRRHGHPAARVYATRRHLDDEEHTRDAVIALEREPAAQRSASRSTDGSAVRG